MRGRAALLVALLLATLIAGGCGVPLDDNARAVNRATSTTTSTTTGSQVTVNLTSEIDDVSGDSQTAAYAQMVFTVLAFTEFDSVRFSIESNPVEAPTDGPNRPVVTAEDYKFPLNPG